MKTLVSKKKKKNFQKRFLHFFPWEWSSVFILINRTIEKYLLTSVFTIIGTTYQPIRFHDCIWLGHTHYSTFLSIFLNQFNTFFVDLAKKSQSDKRDELVWIQWKHKSYSPDTPPRYDVMQELGLFFPGFSRIPYIRIKYTVKKTLELVVSSSINSSL